MISNTSKQTEKYKIIVAASGSVAAIKLLELVMLIVDWADVKVVMTANVYIHISRLRNSLALNN